MSNIISVTDFRTNVSDIINRVRYQNETIFLTRGTTVVAKLSGVAPGYRYDQELKVAAANARNLGQALAIDIWRLIYVIASKLKSLTVILVEKTKTASISIGKFLKRWVLASLSVEREVSQI